jgi:hypothetical protein
MLSILDLKVYDRSLLQGQYITNRLNQIARHFLHLLIVAQETHDCIRASLVGELRFNLSWEH